MAWWLGKNPFATPPLPTLLAAKNKTKILPLLNHRVQAQICRISGGISKTIWWAPLLPPPHSKGRFSNLGMLSWLGEHQMSVDDCYYRITSQELKKTTLSPLKLKKEWCFFWVFQPHRNSVQKMNGSKWVEIFKSPLSNNLVHRFSLLFRLGTF